MKREFKILEKSRFIFKHPINASDFNPELFEVSHFQEIDDVYMYSQLGTIVNGKGHKGLLIIVFSLSQILCLIKQKEIMILFLSAY